MLTLDEVLRRSHKFVIAVLHALFRQGSCVLDLLLADSSPTRLFSRIVFIGGPGMQHAARTEHLLEFWILGIVVHLRLFLGVEVIKVAEELIEAMNSGQKLVEITQVVLTELPGGVPLILKQIGDGYYFGLQTLGSGGYSNLRESSAVHALAGDERRTSRSARLLTV